MQSALMRISQFKSRNSPESRLFSINILDEISQAAPIQPPNDTSTSDDASVTPVYKRMRETGLLQGFGSARSAITSRQHGPVTVASLVAQVGLPLSALSPRQSTLFVWQAAGALAVIATIQLLSAVGLQSYARPALVVLGVSLAADQFILRGMIFETVYRALFPRYSEKIVTHEAGHFLAAYLCGLPVRGYILSAKEALEAGIPGQAGTLFADDDLAVEIRKGKVTAGGVDRFSIVAMAGIAAEAITYGEAEGGEADITDLLRLLTTLQPPWTEQSVRSQARWAVLQAVLLLRGNQKAFEALQQAMKERKSLGECVACIEENFVEVESNISQKMKKNKQGRDSDKENEIAEREKAIIKELEKIREKVDELSRD